MGIRVLISKSLIKVGDNNKFIMHDQLRDLGRQIVSEEGETEPWKRSRLWRTKDALQTLKTSQDTSSVNAISLEDTTGGISVVASHFENLPNLRYLSMFNVVEVHGDFKNLLPNLRWFQCIGKPYSLSGYAFPNLNMENLVVLHISDCVLRTDWDGWNKLKMINNLKYLNLIDCDGLEGLLDLSNLTKLVEVDVSRCRNLTVIQGLDKLESLERLDARYCIKLNQIEGVQKLISLKHLDLDGCWELKGLGDLSNLTKLVELILSGCYNLTVIQGLDKLESLERLDASFCSELNQIEGVQKLTSLEYLNLEGCIELKGLGDLSNLKKIKKIFVSYCVKLSKILGLEELKSLTYLDVRGCKRLGHLPILANVFVDDQAMGFIRGLRGLR